MGFILQRKQKRMLINLDDRTSEIQIGTLPLEVRSTQLSGFKLQCYLNYSLPNFLPKGVGIRNRYYLSPAAKIDDHVFLDKVFLFVYYLSLGYI